MFTKRGSYEKKVKTTGTDNKEPEKIKRSEDVPNDIPVGPSGAALKSSSVNKILKGSKLTGDINVACDLEVSGDVEGNITSIHGSNILIKGACRGNIETKEGNVNIEGELHGGNITAGKNVNISGKFKGGEVKALGKIFVDGEFKGKLEGNDVEIGANANGKGEIFYKEYISISKGARVEVQIAQSKKSLKEVKTPAKTDSAGSNLFEKAAEDKKGDPIKSTS